MVIIFAESLTALLYLYLGLSLPWSSWHTLVGTLRELHFVLVITAAAATAWGVARHRLWATKAAVVVAAYTGLPNLAAIGSFVQSLQGVTQPPVMLSLLFVLIATLVQLVAFVLALRQLHREQAAA